MGIYLNPSNVGFKQILAADIYVDKTMMISELNKFIDKCNQYICVSRPRRFGKTFATNMLCAYYSKGCDSREMFQNLKISKADNYETYLHTAKALNAWLEILFPYILKDLGASRV